MNQFRIAIIFALMATTVWAGDAWTCDGSGQCFDGSGQPFRTVTPQTYWRPPSAGQTTAPMTANTTPKTKCLPGWTLVDVYSSHSEPIHKCAAVGDLRDPE